MCKKGQIYFIYIDFEYERVTKQLSHLQAEFLASLPYHSEFWSNPASRLSSLFTLVLGFIILSLSFKLSWYSFPPGVPCKRHLLWDRLHSWSHFQPWHHPPIPFNQEGKKSCLMLDSEQTNWSAPKAIFLQLIVFDGILALWNISETSLKHLWNSTPIQLHKVPVGWQKGRMTFIDLVPSPSFVSFRES